MSTMVGGEDARGRRPEGPPLEVRRSGERGVVCWMYLGDGVGWEVGGKLNQATCTLPCLRRVVHVLVGTLTGLGICDLQKSPWGSESGQAFLPLFHWAAPSVLHLD